MIVSGATLSSAQNVVIWKHVLRFSHGWFLPDSYIFAKYSYRDNTLLYRLDYTDNGWQIIDSVSYKKSNGLWYITHFDEIEDIGFKLHYGYSDTTQNLHYTNDDLQTLNNLLNVATTFILNYTGITEIDNYQDFVIVVFILVQDMWDNRTLYVDKNNLNKVVETILGMHSVNLL